MKDRKIIEQTLVTLENIRNPNRKHQRTMRTLYHQLDKMKGTTEVKDELHS